MNVRLSFEQTCLLCLAGKISELGLGRLKTHRMQFGIWKVFQMAPMMVPFSLPAVSPSDSAHLSSNFHL
uniref:Uncharacterized protein n=1 Tax=Rhizophora mucronata TaxID=61149 RepID=A0A2P2N8X8_RHIMU